MNNLLKKIYKFELCNDNLVTIKSITSEHPDHHFMKTLLIKYIPHIIYDQFNRI